MIQKIQMTRYEPLSKWCNTKRAEWIFKNNFEILFFFQNWHILKILEFRKEIFNMMFAKFI